MAWTWTNIDWNQTQAAAVSLAAVTQAVFAGIMMLGLRHARRQADAAQTSLAVMERTAERQLRAYVHIDDIRMARTSAANVWAMELTAKNVGQTPASRATLRTMAFTSSAARIPHLEMDESASIIPEASVGAGCENYFTLTLPAGLGPIVPNRADGEALYLCVMGILTYRDVFDVERKTGFGMHIYPEHSEEDFVVSSSIGEMPGNFTT